MVSTAEFLGWPFGLNVVKGEVPHDLTVESLLLTLLAVIGLNNLLPKAVPPHGLLVAQLQRLSELHPNSTAICLSGGITP